MNEQQAVGMDAVGETGEVPQRRADDCKLALSGRLVEIGRLENEGGADGFLVDMRDGRFVTVKGLTETEVRKLGRHWGDNVALRFFAEGA